MSFILSNLQGNYYCPAPLGIVIVQLVWVVMNISKLRRPGPGYYLGIPRAVTADSSRAYKSLGPLVLCTLSTDGVRCTWRSNVNSYREHASHR